MSHKERQVIGVDDRVSVGRAIPLGIQHMMSMFGSTVLVPMLTGLHPSLAIMCSGIGTICYLLVTRNKIPSYLGSSFAFISPIIAVGATRGLDAALSGVVVAGLVFLFVAGSDELDADADEQYAADRHQEGNMEETGNNKGQGKPQDNGPNRTVYNSPLLQMRRQVLSSHADDNGIIAAQGQIDQDDLGHDAEIK